METFIGCSGYYYNHWKELFYPVDLPKNKWLPYYARHFNTVEINNTFYKMPEEKPVRNWVAVTPPDFVFAVKGFRYFTHRKRLIVDEEMLGLLSSFQHTISYFGNKLGPVLWQLPPGFKADPLRLDKFCSVLSREFYHVFEFRNSTWYNEDIYDVLKRYNFCQCIVSGPQQNPVIETTSDFAYVRFHGEGSWYRDNYNEQNLIAWHLVLSGLKVKKLYAYFNNDVNGYALNNGKFFDSLFKNASQT